MARRKLSPADMAKEMDISTITLKRYRLNPETGWISRIHYWKPNPNRVWYYPDAIAHWEDHDPVTHLKWCQRQLKAIAKP